MTAAVRVRYREGQLLHAADLITDQDHHAAARRRHDRTAHGWGVVTGLDLDGTTLRPGVAVDALGRTLVVGDERDLLALLPGGGAADVWLRHCTVHERGRIREGTRLEVAPAGDGGVPARARPDAVYLGRITGAGGGRTTAGLRAAAVKAPAGTVRVEVGGDDRTQLAVHLPADGSARLTVDRSGRLVVRSAATVHAAARAATVTWSGGGPVPAEPRPWQVHRVDITDEEDRSRVVARELRWELEHPGRRGDPRAYRLVIGRREAGGGFSRLLTVPATGAVAATGPVLVAGTVTQGPVGVDPADPRLAQAIQEQWLAGLTSSAAAVDAAFGGAQVVPDLLAVRVEADSDPTSGDPFDYRLEVENTGAERLAHVTLVEQRIVGGTTAGQQVPVRGLALAPGAIHVVGRQVTPTGGPLTVTAVALGVTPSGAVAYGSAPRTWFVPLIIP